MTHKLPKHSTELDRRVAEATGWRHIDDESNEGIPPKGDYKYAPLPHPSTDLNAAFAAAEEVRLFDEWCLGLGLEWEVMTEGDYLAGREVFVSAPTPALAICAAILKLKAKDA